MVQLSLHLSETRREKTNIIETITDTHRGETDLNPQHKSNHCIANLLKSKNKLGKYAMQNLDRDGSANMCYVIHHIFLPMVLFFQNLIINQVIFMW